MSTGHCCGARNTVTPQMIDGDGLHRPALMRRCFAGTGWLVPAAILAFLPKCPACLAAYLAIGTGLGLSVPTASYVRDLLILSCAASFVCPAHRHWPAIVKFIPYTAGTRQRKSQ